MNYNEELDEKLIRQLRFNLYWQEKVNIHATKPKTHAQMTSIFVKEIEKIVQKEGDCSDN